MNLEMWLVYLGLQLIRTKQKSQKPLINMHQNYYQRKSETPFNIE